MQVVGLANSIAQPAAETGDGGRFALSAQPATSVAFDVDVRASR
ncbi:hypothetical protein AB0O70_04925 [Microbacterium paraoxydans]